jgi:DNA methylase
MTASRSETPDTVHGRLLESVHLSGYTFERACSELEWLLDKDRWRKVGRGFDDIHAFMATLDFSELRPVAEKRKKIAKRLAVLDASQRRTARLLGVGKDTIARDLEKRGGAKAPASLKSANETGEVSEVTGASAPWFQSDADPTREAKRETARAQRDADRSASRDQAVVDARAILDTQTYGVHHESCTALAARLAPESTPLVFTDPPYHDDTLPVYADLGRLAAQTLTPGGSLITYAAHHRLPEIVGMLQQAGLTFFWPIVMLHTGRQARMTEYGIVVTYKPLLWFVKGSFRCRDAMTFVTDSIASAPEKDLHPWQQGTIEARYYIEQLTQPGDLVVDPFCGGGTTAVAALQAHRQWITCDVDEASVILARRRVMEASNGAHG